MSGRSGPKSRIAAAGSGRRLLHQKLVDAPTVHIDHLDPPALQVDALPHFRQLAHFVEDKSCNCLEVAIFVQVERPNGK